MAFTGDRQGDAAIVIAEDRADCQIGVKLLLLSLAEHPVDADILVTCPNADEAFAAWCKARPRVRFSAEPVPGAWHWNVKPQALTLAFDEGYGRALWIDSDILVAGPGLEGILDKVAAGDFVMSEESGFTGSARWATTADCTRGWGFEVARSWPRILNSGLVGCSPAHAPLLDRWRELIGSDAYVAEQKTPIDRRGIHAIGDQNVLAALLGAPEFADVPVHVVPEGLDIVQYLVPASYAPKDRLRAAQGRPPFLVHAQGLKPWRIVGETAREAPDRAFAAECSPYKLFAERLLRHEGEDLPEWITRQTPRGRRLRRLAKADPHMTGFLPAAAQYYGSKAKRRLTALTGRQRP